MDKVKCKCGVKGFPGSKCKACSAMIYAHGGIVKDPTVLILDPDPALYIPDDEPITFSEDTDIEYKEEE